MPESKKEEFESPFEISGCYCAETFSNEVREIDGVLLSLTANYEFFTNSFHGSNLLS